jgi:hypothetical protein
MRTPPVDTAVTGGLYRPLTTAINRFGCGSAINRGMAAAGQETLSTSMTHCKLRCQ